MKSASPAKKRKKAPPESRCTCCQGRDVRWEFYAKGIPEDETPFELLRCVECGLGWIEPMPGPDEIGRWYPPAYYGKGNVRFHWSLEMLVRLFRKRRASMIRNRVPPSPVLDVGCGRGRILGTLKSFGYQPFGVEISEHAAWHARNKMGATMHVGALEDAPFEEGSFGAVIFWHSLEHVSDPMASLRKARELLKPGGLLVVAVPNSESMQARLTGRNWFHLDIPRHYFHFGTTALSHAMRATGFEVVETAHFSFEQNPYGWLQSLYNAFGFRFNLLYDVIKNKTSRMAPLRKNPLQALCIAALLPVFLPLSLLLTVLEAVLQRGGTVEMYAIKK